MLFAETESPASVRLSRSDIYVCELYFLSFSFAYRYESISTVSAGAHR
jgi:hypothetical protein